MFSHPLFIYKIWRRTKLQFTPLLNYFHVYSRTSDVKPHVDTHVGQRMSEKKIFWSLTYVYLKVINSIFWVTYLSPQAITVLVLFANESHSCLQENWPD